MENKLKKWELALLVGLLVGLLASPADAAQLPLSRWQIEDDQIRYQVSLFPFGFAQAEKTVMVTPPQETETGYEVKWKIVEWLEGVFA